MFFLTPQENFKKVFCFLVLLNIIFLTGAFIPQETKAQGASLYFAPAGGSFFVDGTFDVSIFVNTGGNNINAVKVNVRFDPKKVQVASPTAGKSFIEVWVSQPTYSNTEGTMSFTGGVPSPGINTSAGLVSTVTFRAIAPGETAVYFEESSIHLDDGQGTNILTSRGRGVYALLIPPPEGPKVYSPTHPDQNKWYRNNNPTFSWEKEEGITDFSYSLDQDSSGVPDSDSEGDQTAVSYSNVEDGILYFHVKAKKEGIWGGTSHYLARIDTTPPASFTPVVAPSVKTADKQPLISFVTTDALSGIDHYEIKTINITPGRQEEATGFFTEAASPYELPSLEAGKYLIVVRAFDVAGNSREETIKIEIVPRDIFISREGIYIKGFMLYWWQFFLILIIVIILIIFSLRRKQKSAIKRKQERIRGLKEGLESQKKEILDKIEKKKDVIKEV